MIVAENSIIRSMTTQQTLWDKCWHDSRGQIVIWQGPNLWLWGWLGATILAKLVRVGFFATSLQLLGSSFLLIWAILEFTHGANYFRRLLGLIVLVWLVISYVQY